MKRVIVLSIAVCMMLAGVAFAQDSGDDTTATNKVPTPKVQHIDTGEDAPGAGPRTGVNEGAVMPAYESYDENTGMPDVVPADSEDEMQ